MIDPIRGGARVEIPSAFLLAILKFKLSEQIDLAKELIDLILANQQASGAWLEYPYHEREEKIGYEGVIPTCFAAMALMEAHRVSDWLWPAEKNKNKDTSSAPVNCLDAARRSVEYLCRVEHGGYFVKASFNKSDVINTNLFASLTIRTFAATLPDYSQLGRTIGFAVNRALLRAISSELPNGSLPYISYGLRTSYLYHAMATALLGLHLKYVPNGLVRASFRRALHRLTKLIDPSGRFNWEKAKLKDKEGAVWAYGWAANCFILSDDLHRQNLMLSQLAAFRDEEFLRNGDFDQREDVFYTAWTVEALSLAENQPLAARSAPFGSWLKSLLISTLAWPKRLLYLLKVLKRKIIKSPLDSGPAEEN